MKFLALALCLAVVSAHRRPKLKHFNKNGLSQKFQKHELPAGSSCDAAMENNIKCSHKLATKCVGLWMHSQQGPEVARCKRQDTVKAADKTWQEASFTYHLAMQKCLEGAAPDVQQEETFLFRKKRSCCGQRDSSSSDEDRKKRSFQGGRSSSSSSDDRSDNSDRRRRRHGSHSSHSSSEELENCNLNHDNQQACWQAFSDHKRDHIESCPKMARCNGVESAAPEGGDELYWFNRVKELKVEKKQAIQNYMRLLHECLGTEAPEWN